MFEKIAKQFSRIFGNAAMETMTEAEVLNALEDMPTIEQTASNASDIAVLTESLTAFETRLAGIDELSTKVATLESALGVSRDEVAMLNERLTATMGQNEANFNALATDISTIKGTATTVVATAASAAPVEPAKPAATGEIKNDVIGKRLAGVKIGTFSNTRNNFQHN